MVRRLRRSPALRAMVRENQLLPADFIYPLFVHEGAEVEPIGAMLGASRWSLDRLSAEVQRAWDLGIRCVVLFPKVAEGLKTEDGSESFNANGLIPRAIRQLKRDVPDMAIMTDVALDPYSCDGHDGIVRDGVVLNDETLIALEKQTLVQAEAGADILGPSDMMDGRVGVMRRALEQNDCPDTAIMAYSAKYASAFYGPFRDAVGASGVLKGDKKTYQLDSGNTDEAIRMVARDLKEGADMVMVKPGMPYLDICHRVSSEFGVPTYAYQVSGEYAMIYAAGQNGWIDHEKAMLESLLAFKRAGCSGILSYFALDVAQRMADQTRLG